MTPLLQIAWQRSGRKSTTESHVTPWSNPCRASHFAVLVGRAQDWNTFLINDRHNAAKFSSRSSPVLTNCLTAHPWLDLRCCFRGCGCREFVVLVPATLSSCQAYRPWAGRPSGHPPASRSEPVALPMPCFLAGLLTPGPRNRAATSLCLSKCPNCKQSKIIGPTAFCGLSTQPVWPTLSLI